MYHEIAASDAMIERKMQPCSKEDEWAAFVLRLPSFVGCAEFKR